LGDYHLETQITVELVENTIKTNFFSKKTTT